MAKNKKITEEYLKSWIVSSSNLLSENFLKEMTEYNPHNKKEEPEALTRKVLIEKTNKLTQGLWQYTNEVLGNIDNDIFSSTALMLYALRGQLTLDSLLSLDDKKEDE